MPDTTVIKCASANALVGVLFAAWSLAIGCALVAFTSQVPPWGGMWLLSAGIFFAIKATILHVAQVPGPPRALLAFIFGWPGLNPARFLREYRSGGSNKLIRNGILNLLFGVALLWLVTPQCVTHPEIAAWTGMSGIVFVLHFGWFHLITAFWRRMGRDVEPLMHCPLAAASLADFWGRRWNTAFRDAARQLVFRPLAARRNAKTALWLVFLVSGLLHELVISLQAHGGYGGPTLYFLLQASGLHLARHYPAIDGRVWAFAILLTPLGLLLHPPFVHRVMLPFLQSIGALP